MQASRDRVANTRPQKSDGDISFTYLASALKPLQAKGYLTTYNTTNSTWSRGPLTIVGTGNTPLSRVFYSSPRSIFLDAPLVSLSRPALVPASPYGPATSVDWSPEISPMASSKFPFIFHAGIAFPPPPGNVVVNRLRQIDAVAKKKGIRSRWWGAARRPDWVRRRVWELVYDGAAGWVNGDDLTELASWMKQRKG
jgi:hypothetical protein